MTELIDARPAGLDVLFRPANTFVATLTWPAGSLAGRSFTSQLDAATLVVGIAGDVMTITASEAQTIAAAPVGLFTLTETTGGPTEVILSGRWAPSLGPAASTGADVLVVTDDVSVGVSAVGVSLSEVQSLIAAQPVLSGAQTLYVSRLGADPLFGQKVVGNTTTETTLLGGTVSMPTLTVGSTARFLVAGDLKNSSGGAATLTLRFKAAGTAVFTLATSMPNDANTRPYRFMVDVQQLGATAATISGGLDVHPGAGGVSITAVGIAALATMGGSTQAWDVSAQWSVANANTTMQRLLANLIYGIAP